MGSTPSAKRINAKLSSAPTRNALNITGASGQGAASPISIKVAEALRNSMNSGDMANGPTPAAASSYKRKKQASFGDPSAILQSATKKLKGNAFDALPAKKGSVGFPGNGVD